MMVDTKTPLPSGEGVDSCCVGVLLVDNETVFTVVMPVENARYECVYEWRNDDADK